MPVTVLLLVAALQVAVASPSQSVGPPQSTGSSAASYRLGPLRFSLTLPAGWKLVDVAKARPLLDKDGVVESPLFAIEGPAGGMLYGTWKQLPAGVTFSADAIAAMEDPALAKWGIKPSDIKSFADRQAKGLRFAYLRAKGLGSGLEFSAKLKTPTVGLWVDIPVAFRADDGIHSGLASLYYRSSAAEATAGGEALFLDLIDAIEPTSSVVPSTAVPAAAQPANESKPIITPPSSSLPAWPAGLQDAAQRVTQWPTDAASYSAGLEQLDRLGAIFPANQWIKALGEEWRSTRKERAQVGEWLKGADAEARRKELAGLHETALQQISLRGNAMELAAYLGYVNAIWPDNPFLRPPTAVGSGAQWKHWPTGQVLQRSLVLGRVFWHSLTPVCQLSQFAGGSMPSGLRLPDADEYEVMLKQGAISATKGTSWLMQAGPAQAAWMEFDKGRLIKLKHQGLTSQCFAVWAGK